ncbi:MAG TPA: SGNH/GDSL hydrolase family protein [Chromatiales bacterium]|nr:SGNH/GDSL hydrolase family protein [Chromatiales bacterium]
MHRPFVILALGDCNTRGSEALPPGAAFPERLGELLRGDGVEARVHNLGCTMATTREGVARMEREGAALAADLVTVNFGLVDAWVTTLPGIYVPYYPDNPLRKYRRKLLKAVKRRLRNPRIRACVPTGEVVHIDEYTANLRRIVALARGANPGAQIVLWGSAPVAEDAERDRNLCRYDAAMREVAVAEGCDYLDTRALLEAGGPRSELYLDRVHLSARGHELLARAIHELCRGRVPAHG